MELRAGGWQIDTTWRVDEPIAGVERGRATRQQTSADMERCSGSVGLVRASAGPARSADLSVDVSSAIMMW